MDTGLGNPSPELAGEHAPGRSSRRRAARFAIVGLGWVLCIIAARSAMPLPRSGDAAPGPSLATRPTDERYMGSLVGGEHTVRIYSTREGARYSLVDGSGNVLLDRVPVEVLAHRYPSLDVAGMVADAGASRGGPVMLAEPE